MPAPACTHFRTIPTMTRTRKKAAGNRGAPKAPVPVKVSGIKPGRNATINDIARLASVSKKTVSRVINQSPLVQEAHPRAHSGGHRQIRLRTRSTGAWTGISQGVPHRAGLRQPERAIHRELHGRRARCRAQFRIRSRRASVRSQEARLHHRRAAFRRTPEIARRDPAAAGFGKRRTHARAHRGGLCVRPHHLHAAGRSGAHW